MIDLPPVLILAGGLGTRVRSVEPELPKALISVNGEPFIGHQLRLLARQKIKEVILCLGYRCELIAKYVGAGENFDIEVNYSYDGEQLLGTGGAIRQAQSRFNLNKPFAVLYGDSYLNTSFTSIYEAFLQAKKSALMTVFKNNNQWVRSNLVCRQGMVIEYEKDKPTGDMQYVDYGLSIFEAQAIQSFPDNKTFDLTEVFLALIKEKQLAACEVQERFYEAGSPQGLKELFNYLTAFS